MAWDGWERQQVSEKRRVLYSNDDRERERKEKSISREREEMNEMTGLITKEEEEERENELSVNFSSFRSIDVNRAKSSEKHSSNLVEKSSFIFNWTWSRLNVHSTRETEEQVWADEKVRAMNEKRIEEVFGLSCPYHGLDHLDVFVESTTREQ